jgi:hypothetical protein
MTQDEIHYLTTPSVVVNLAAAILAHAFRDNDRPVHHYTTFDGLHGILRSGKLWATDTRYLNDTTERVHAEQLMAGFLKDLNSDCETQFRELLDSCVANAFKSTFVTCFCENGDLLSMWRGYGASGGFSIEFDGAKLRALLNPTFETFGKVKYHVDLHAALADPLNKLCDYMKSNPLSESERNGISGSFAQMLVLMKHPAFEEEQEWRIVVPELPIDRMNFRPTASGPKPYLDFPVTYLGAADPNAKELLPIRKVTIGPTLRSPETEYTVRKMLLKYGYGENVEVVRSIIPFRG